MMKKGEGGATRWLALGLLLLGLLPGCRSGDSNPAAMQEPSRAPNEGMRGVRIQNIRVGDTRWVLAADSASVFRETKRVEAYPVEVNFFEEERHVSTLTAKLGILLQTTDDLEARGDVRVVTDEGTVLETEVLFWDHQRALIHTEEFVRIEKGEDVLTGFGMEADPGLNRIDIRRNVHGSVRDPEQALGEEDEG
ncbi:MAG: LPS export ABC transporter periplasmic protein LptC [Candidatus Eiseniibacteriota bacterium]